MKQTQLVAREAELLHAAEGLARLVDEYVMVVTEGLCALENGSGHIMQQPENDGHKTRILQELDALDALMVRYRNRIAPDSALPSMPERPHGS